MSEEDVKQTVADTESEAQPSPETEDKSSAQAEDEQRDYLAEALKEWDERPVNVPQPEIDVDDTDDEDRLRQTVYQMQRRQERQELDNVVSKVRGDLPAEMFEDTLVEAWIDAQARKNPVILKAWQERNENPKKFESLVNGLSKEYAKKNKRFLGYDEKATEDRELVAHAVRGGSKPAPADKMPELGSMNDGDYRKFIADKFGYDPGV